jgi:hypothetical protein
MSWARRDSQSPGTVQHPGPCVRRDRRSPRAPPRHRRFIPKAIPARCIMPQLAPESARAGLAVRSRRALLREAPCWVRRRGWCPQGCSGAVPRRPRPLIGGGAAHGGAVATAIERGRRLTILSVTRAALPHRACCQDLRRELLVGVLERGQARLRRGALGLRRSFTASCCSSLSSPLCSIAMTADRAIAHGRRAVAAGMRLGLGHQQCRTGDAAGTSSFVSLSTSCPV